MMLRGYRDSDRALLTGYWLPGELVGRPVADRPPLAEPTTVTPPADPTTEMCVVPGTAFVRFTDLDWVNRRARLETGLRPEAVDDGEVLLKSAVSHGFRVLNLHRVYGWVTPACGVPVAALRDAGFQLEATVPDAIWLDGRPVERQLWGAVRHD